jgi:hypothetical protein
MRNTLIGAVLVVLTAAGALWWPSDKDPEQDSRYLVGRVWLERLPKTERDQIHLLALVSEGRDKVGTLAFASAWRVQAENFRFQLQHNRLKLDFPQDHKRLALKVKSYKCEAPEPFTLCLELKNKSGKDEAAKTFRFYSREDWSFDGSTFEGDDLPAGVAAAVAAQLERAQHSQMGAEHAWDEHGDTAMSPYVLGQPVD